MVGEGLITKEQAVARVDPTALDQLLHPTLDPGGKEGRDRLGPCRVARRGDRRGRVHRRRGRTAPPPTGRDVILVRLETSPEDIHGMHAAKGILTVRGGMTSHAAVVARGMGRPCVTGAGSLKVDAEKGTMAAGGVTVSRGEPSPSMAARARSIAAACRSCIRSCPAISRTLMGWADAIRTMKVRTNADTPADCETARRFGAEGIGLCRTEHMFFDADRIVAVREMILADDVEGRRRGARQALAHAARRFRGDLQDHGGFAGDHPSARSAAARISSAHG